MLLWPMIITNLPRVPADPGWNGIPEPSPLDALLPFLNVAPEVFPT